MPSTLRSSSRLAASTRSGFSKTSSSLRKRTGPTVGSMFSAIHASAEFIESIASVSLAIYKGKPEARATSERNLVFVGRRLSRFWWGCGRFRRARLSIFIAALSATSSSRRTAAEQLHGFADHAQLAAFLTSLFVVPRVHLQPAFDKNGATFLQIFARDFGQTRPENNIDIGDLLAFFAAFEGVLSVNRDAEVANRAALGGVTDLRIAGEVSEQDDFVQTGHASVIARSFRVRQLFRRFFLLLLFFGEPLVMLTVNLGIEFEFRAELNDELRIGFENKVHVKARIEGPSRIGELALVHFLHLLDRGALLFEFGFEPINDVVDAVFLSLRIEHEQGFVTFFHVSSSSILLNVFIAETTPLSIAHFTASTARSTVDLTSGFSSSKKRPRT